MKSDVEQLPTFPWQPLDVPINVPQEDINALNLEVTPETATDIFKQTKKQADSVRWFEVRKLRLTASKFGLISKRKKDKESLV